jgi:hypothetical protein
MQRTPGYTAELVATISVVIFVLLELSVMELKTGIEDKYDDKDFR